MKLTEWQIDIVRRAGGNDDDLRKIEAEEVVMDWDMAEAGCLPVGLLPMDMLNGLHALLAKRDAGRQSGH